MRLARFLVTAELLREFFRLPDGTEVVCVESIWRDAGGGVDLDEIEITVTHPDLRDVKGLARDAPPIIRPTYRKDGDAVVFVDWGQG